MENPIDGVVITFADIAGVTRVERAGQEVREYLESIFPAVREPLLVLDEYLRLVSANQALYPQAQGLPRQVEGELFYEIGGAGGTGRNCAASWSRCSRRKKPSTGFALRPIFRTRGTGCCGSMPAACSSGRGRRR